MNQFLSVRLSTTPAQAEQLALLQAAFAEVCNALAPVVQQTRCWNRVGLHHLAYRTLRERFPKVGSQMVCNAIYSVSRACRVVYKEPDKPLPLLRFLPDAPVFFDRHTLSIKDGQLSMYTLDGRMHFQLDLSAEDLNRFQDERLREIVLSRSSEGYFLRFLFASEDDGKVRLELGREELPEYILVLPHDAAATESLAIDSGASVGEGL